MRLLLHTFHQLSKTPLKGAFGEVDNSTRKPAVYTLSFAGSVSIANVIEKCLLELKHPEMPKEKPNFKLHVDGKESWSWADIEPNWMFNDENPPNVNPFNENARDILGKE